MRYSVLLTALILGTMSIGAAGTADAADLAVYRRAPAVVHALPFARSARAEAVWASDACWNECGAHTAWALVGCLSRDTQGRCLTRADAGDRACQRACRIYGGPYWPID